ncbi:MAG: DUF192 domain-containing protein [archaeon]
MNIQLNSGSGTVNAKVAVSDFQKLRGLMFRLKPGPLFFEFKEESKFDSAIHMLFVFQSLDLVYLNSKWEVVDIKKALPFIPYYAPKEPAKYLIELPSGQGELFKIGEKLNYQYF